jgi:hypothetical protein
VGTAVFPPQRGAPSSPPDLSEQRIVCFPCDLAGSVQSSVDIRKYGPDFELVISVVIPQQLSSSEPGPPDVISVLGSESFVAPEN